MLDTGTYIFQSVSMKRLLRQLESVCTSDIPIFLTGATGAGKEVIADIIHKNSKRRNYRFVKINCASIPSELLESELFGSIKGAYTGSVQNKQGVFKEADNGTLLLDEIGDMPPNLQPKLLRVLQDGRIRPVGGTIDDERTVDVRTISTTNQNLSLYIEDKKFRADLYYRLAGIELSVPLLEERIEDILPLAYLFLKQFANKEEKQCCDLTDDIKAWLQSRVWEGNVRELRNIIWRAVAQCPPSILMLGKQYFPIKPVDNITKPQIQSELSCVDLLMKDSIANMLAATNGNHLLTAKRLGIGRQTLYNKMKKFNLKRFKA